MKKHRRTLLSFNYKGFTLAELLVALVVTSVVLTAVATLAYALGTVNDATDDTSGKQAQVRYATLRVSELIRPCKLICATPGSDLAVWRADDNGDGQININELVYIDSGANRDHIRLYQCSSASNPIIMLSDIDSVGTSWWLGFYDSGTYTEMIARCGNVEFLTNLPAPQTRFVSISFDLQENGVMHNYQISASLRSWAGQLLSGSGDSIVGDDD